VRELLRPSEKIVVISGAGISANAGCDSNFQELRKSKMAPLDRSLYFFAQDIRRFHSTILELFERLQSDSCMPTPFHRLMDNLAHEQRLLHHITQNFDCVEQQLPALEAKTVRLHGRLDQMRCQKCNQVRGLRPLSIGRLKPDVLLCGEPHPDDNEIVEAVEHDMAMRPDLALVVGTRLERDGPRSIVTSLCKAARRSGGVAVWISKEEPALFLRPLFDYILMGGCDGIVSSSVRGF
ncbi:DHS-like NAD/FAD-binding domain-containing protein, partial [Cadophora sp. DSE1049]